MSYLKLLLIDDDPLIRKGLRSMIRRLAPQWTVVGEAENGDAVPALVGELGPQLLITDICMPGTDGIRMFASVKERYPDVHCLVLSGYSEFEYAREMLKLGALDYLIKPVEEELLLEHLGKVERLVLSDSEHRWRQKEQERQLGEYWFRELASGFRYEVRDCEQQLQRLGVPTDSAFYLLLCISPDRDELEPDERGPCLFFLYKAAQELLEIGAGTAFRAESEETYALLWDDDAAALLERMRDFEERLFAFVRQSSRWRVTIGTSSPFEHLGVFKEAADQARNALKYKVILGSERNILWHGSNLSGAAASGQHDQPSPGQIGKELLASLHGKDLAAAEAIIAGALRGDRVKLYSLHYLHGLYAALLMSLEQFAQQNGTDLEEASEASFIGTMDRLREMERVDRAADTIAGMARRLLSRIDETRNQIDTRLIAKIKQYIQKRLSDNLTLQGTAEHVHLHPNYVSELFKQATGQTFIDYVIRLRIELAIELLKEDKLKWYEIAERVGYASPKHFTKMFKKTVGMAPSEFKKSR